jgi:hypothetical protein
MKRLDIRQRKVETDARVQQDSRNVRKQISSSSHRTATQPGLILPTSRSRASEQRARYFSRKTAKHPLALAALPCSQPADAWMLIGLAPRLPRFPPAWLRQAASIRSSSERCLELSGGTSDGGVPRPPIAVSIQCITLSLPWLRVGPNIANRNHHRSSALGRRMGRASNLRAISRPKRQPSHAWHGLLRHCR